MNDLKKYRTENGLCLYCGCEIDRAGIYCYECLEKVNAMKRVINQRKHRNGVCIACGIKLDREGWLCIECSKKLNLRGRIRNKFRKENSLCVHCGKESIGYSVCQECRDKRMERYYNKKEK